MSKSCGRVQDFTVSNGSLLTIKFPCNLFCYSLSQNIAGVTILAFGNGAPDIFSSLAGIGANRPELVFGELFGAGMFVTAMVAGAVCWLKPFDLMKRPFLRDVTFYIVAGFWAFCIFYRLENDTVIELVETKIK